MEDKLSCGLTLKELKIMADILKTKAAILDCNNKLLSPIINRMGDKVSIGELPDECFTIQSVPYLETLTQLIKRFDKLTEHCSYQSAKESINKNVLEIIKIDVPQCKETEHILVMHLKHNDIDMVRITTETRQFTILREFSFLQKGFKVTLDIPEVALSRDDIHELVKDIFEYPEGVSHQGINALKLEILLMVFDKWNPDDI